MWWLSRLLAATPLLGFAAADGESFGLQLVPQGSGDDVPSFVRRMIEPRHAVAVLTVSEGSKRHTLLEELANEDDLRQVLTFGVSFAPKGSSLTVHRHRYPSVAYDGKWTRTALRTWLLQVGYPPVNRMADHFAPAKYLTSSLFGVVLIVKPLDQQTDALVMALEPFAQKYRDRLKFTFFTKTVATQGLCETYGIWSNNELLLLEQPGHSRRRSHSHVLGPPKFRLEGVTAESVAEFFAGYAAGALPRYLQTSVPRSEALRRSGTAGAVRELTSWDFAEVVRDPAAAVLLEFVSSDCDRCEEFREAYEEVARRARALAARVPSSPWSALVVARIDQTSNEHTETVRGTPWMKFWPRGRRRKAIDVELRSVESILSFLEEQLSDDASAEL